MGRQEAISLAADALEEYTHSHNLNRTHMHDVLTKWTRLTRINEAEKGLVEKYLWRDEGKIHYYNMVQWIKTMP